MVACGNEILQTKYTHVNIFREAPCDGEKRLDIDNWERFEDMQSASSSLKKCLTDLPTEDISRDR